MMTVSNIGGNSAHMNTNIDLGLAACLDMDIYGQAVSLSLFKAENIIKVLYDVTSIGVAGLIETNIVL